MRHRCRGRPSTRLRHMLVPELLQVGQEFVQFLVRLKDVGTQLVYRCNWAHALTSSLLIKLGGVGAAPVLCEVSDAHDGYPFFAGHGLGYRQVQAAARTTRRRPGRADVGAGVGPARARERPPVPPGTALPGYKAWMSQPCRSYEVDVASTS